MPNKAADTERASSRPKTPTITRPTQPLKTTTPNRKHSPAHPAFSAPLKEGLNKESQSEGLFRVSHRVFLSRYFLDAQEHRRRCVSRWMLHRLHRCLTRAREPTGSPGELDEDGKSGEEGRSRSHLRQHLYLAASQHAQSLQIATIANLSFSRVLVFFRT